MIRLKNLTKFYYSGESVSLALDYVSLQFDVGDFVVVTGESGSGKSTLLKVISGLETYEDGEMYLNGVKTSAFGEEDWEELRREQIAMVYQDYRLLDNYSVVENVESVLLICEKRLGVMTPKERREKAVSYLNMVGLSAQAGQKAGHISSGQKQRLGIARALAKQTKIIIADEPTGNLDAENGSQIMELFGELAKNHLVLVVTHNIEQAEPYITRRVRLFDGSVTEDVRVRPNRTEVREEPSEIIKESGDTSNQQEAPQGQTVTKGEKGKGKRIGTLTRMELKGTPVLSILLFVFFLCSAFSMLFVLGIFAENQDDLNARAITGMAFLNKADTRLVIRTKDGSTADRDVLKKMAGISHVVCVDAYDTVNDINYMYRENQDYEQEKKYTGITGYQKKKITLTDFTHYMRSETCISEHDLKEGHLPESYFDIVVGSEDADLYGTAFPVYFCAPNVWGTEVYICLELKVVGVCGNINNQIYFDEELCRALSMAANDISATAVYHVEKDVAYQDDPQKDYSFVTDKSYSAILLYNPELEEDEIRIPEEKLVNLEHTQKDGILVNERILEEGQIQIRNPDSTGPEDFLSAEYEARVDEKGMNSHNRILEIGRKLCDDIFKEANLSQASIYMDYYANTDRVIKALDEYGYDLVSVIRISEGDYDDDKVSAQIISLAISAGAALIFLFGDLAVLIMMMRTKRNDYQVLLALGLEEKAITAIIVRQVFFLAGTAFAAAPVISLFAVAAGAERLRSMMYYFRVTHVMVYFLYAIVIVLLCGRLSGRSGKKMRR